MGYQKGFQNFRPQKFYSCLKNIFQLFKRRSKIVKEADSVADEAIRSLASAAIMSDKESGVEQGRRKKKFIKAL